MESETTCVPGPTTGPTGEVPKRPMLSGGSANAAGFTHCLMLLFEGYIGAPATMSARGSPPTAVLAKLVPDGSVPGANTERYGPVWNISLPATSQPPTT